MKVTGTVTVALVMVQGGTRLYKKWYMEEHGGTT